MPDNDNIEEIAAQPEADASAVQPDETYHDESSLVADSAGAEDAPEAPEAAMDVSAEDTAEADSEEAPQEEMEDLGHDSDEGVGDDAGPRPECKDAGNVVGIRFPNSGKTYCFCAGDLKLSRYDRVVVESDLGINIGQVAKVSCEMKVSEKGLKPVLRKVTEADIQQEAENEEVKREARQFAVERIKDRGLPMKLLYADVTLDRKRFIFYFTADTRIDFRELVKDLASKFRSRIELRQIGVRDAARMIGGFGVCGQELCCKTWLKSFAPISIKMAKQQDLVLNTCKLSGLCGRLMCCLNYEYDPSGPKRKRPEPRQKEAPSGEAMEKAIESAIGSGRKDSAPEIKVEAPKSREPEERPRPAEPRPEQKRDAGGESTERKKRKRKRGGRNRNRDAGAAETANRTGAERPAGGQPSAVQPADGQPRTGQPQAGQEKAGDSKDRPRRPRRRRRKPKDKKSE